MEKDTLIKLLQTTLFLSEGMTEEKLVLKLDLAPYLNSAKELLKFISKLDEREYYKITNQANGDERGLRRNLFSFATLPHNKK